MGRFITITYSNPLNPIGRYRATLYVNRTSLSYNDERSSTKMAREVTKDPGLEIVEPLEVIGRRDDGTTPRPIYSMTFTVNFLLKECVGVKEAQFMLGLAWSNYSYALLIAGKLEGAKIACRGYDKWFITKESIAWYKANTLRSEKLRRYDLRIRKEDEDTLRKLMTDAGIAYKLVIAYKAPEPK